jgi:hypothetical protein
MIIEEAVGYEATDELSRRSHHLDDHLEKVDDKGW